MRNTFIPEIGEPAVINFVFLTDFAGSTSHPASRGIVTGGKRSPQSGGWHEP